MEDQEYESRREEIERKYKRKSKSNLFTTYIGMISAGVLGLGLAVYSAVQKNPYENIPVVQECKTMNQTLSTLKDERRQSDLQLPYQPEHLKPYLENVFGEKTKKADSLDKAIEIIESDLTNLINKNPNILKYDNFNKKTSDRILLNVFGTLVLAGGVALSVMYRQYKLDKRKRKELSDLEAKT